MCIDCLKPKSNKYQCECKKCVCDCFYVPIIKEFIYSIAHLVMYKNGSIFKQAQWRN